MLKIITSVFIVSRRLEKHSVLKFICFKLLGHCNVFTFHLSFFSYYMTFSLCWLLDRSCLHSLAFGFWHTVSVLKSISYFVSISSVTFWHLYSTHAFKGARSLPEAVRVLTLGIQTRHSRSIRLHACAPEHSRNLLSAQHFYLTLFTCKIICFIM